MLKGRHMIGKSIIAYATGEKVAQVRDLIFDYHKNRVLGFLVVEAGWLRKGKALAVDAVQSIGPDSVIITRKDAIADLEALPLLKAVVEDDKALINAQIMTTDGQNLGKILDLYFDDQTWAVKGYEASGGLFADIYSGRSFIPAPQTVEIGKDYAFVDPEVVDKMKEQVGGLEAQLHTVGEAVHATAESAGEQWQELSHATTEKLQETRSAAGDTLKATQQAIGDKAQAIMPQPSLDEIKGRRVQRDVRTADGRFIAAPGLIVTDEVIERARQYELEAELIAAVDLPPAEALGHEAKGVLRKTQKHLQDFTHRSGETLSQGTHQVQEGIQHVWHQATDQLGHLQENTAQALEERRIQAALGRRVNRTILDPADQVILQEGAVITHEAIERARDAQMLEGLLNSVEKHGRKPMQPAS